MKISKKAQNIAESPTLALDSQVKGMIQEGLDVINFGVGEPDFDTPAAIKKAAIMAIENGFTKYTAAAGIPSLKKAIVDKFARENGLHYEPEQIVVSVGAKHSLFNVFAVLVEEGDDVLVPAPYWVSYPEQIRLAGGHPVIIPTTLEDGFKLTPAALEAALTPNSRLLVLNSPSNPTGSVYSKEELAALGDMALRYDLTIIADEIYEHLIYQGEHVSIASLSPALKENTVVVNGVSKAYAMTGWRIGYIAAPRAVAKAVSNLQSQSTSNPTSIAQLAAQEALSMDQTPVGNMRDAFNRRRKLMVEGLRSLRGFELIEPLGAFYCFPRVSQLFGQEVAGQVVKDSDHLAKILLEEAKVAAVPGTGFGAPDYLRFSYAIADERILESIDRMRAVLGG